MPVATCIWTLPRFRGVYKAEVMRITNAHSPSIKNRPVQVYLDSQDYSKLSDSMDDPTHRLHALFTKLLGHAEAGEVEFRYSAAHVIEIAHLERQHLDFAMKRARCIEALGRKKCLRFWLEAWRTECGNVVAGHPATDSITNDDACWHPDVSEVATELRQTMLNSFREALLDASVNRQQRRKLQRTLFAGGYLSDAGVDALMKGRKGLVTTLSDEFPFAGDIDAENLMLRFAKGHASPSEVVDAMSVALRDLSTFVGWTYEERDKERKLVVWLRQWGAKLVDIIETLRSNLVEIAERYPNTEIDKKIYDAAIQNPARNFRTSFIRKFRKEAQSLPKNMRGSNSDWQQLEDSEIGTLPALDAYILSVVEHVRRSLMMPRKLKASDAADLVHLCYLPYVDLFRADGDTSQTGAVVAKRFGARIIQKLNALPQEIDRALAARGA